MEASHVLVRMPEVIKITGLARSTIYKLIAERKFPVPVKLTERSVGWHKEELGEWCATRERSLPN